VSLHSKAKVKQGYLPNRALLNKQISKFEKIIEPSTSGLTIDC